MKKYSLETAEIESVGEEAVDDGSLRGTETYPEMHEEAFIDCIVCHYWSERLETTRAHPLSTLGAFEEEKRLIAVLKGHQSYGACARRLPHLLDILLDSRQGQVCRGFSRPEIRSWRREKVRSPPMQLSI